MNRKIFFVAAVLLACTLVSCERENLSSKFNNDGKIGVIVSGTEGVATKAGNTVELIGSTLLEDIDGMDLRLDAYVEENDMMPFAEAVDTKGSIVTTDGINIKDQKFAFNGWLGSTNRYPNDVDNGRTYEEGGSTGRVNVENDKDNYHFLRSTATCGDDKAWSLDPTENWRNAVPTTFWSYYPVGTAGITLPVDKAEDAAQAKVAFAYTTPTAVADQKDILFAYNQHTVTYDNDANTEDSETVNIHFYHALAAIRFDISEAIKDKVTISEIYFKDVVTTGTCAIIGGETSESSLSPGLVTFGWTPDATKKATISQTVASTDYTDGLMPLTSSKLFFFIPQTVKNAVEIGVKYTRADGASFDISVPLTHDAAWEAGKIYTYKLNPAEDVLRIEVLEESVSGNVKNNVSVKNKGNVKAFLRVAVVGNWNVGDDATGAIIDKWTFNPSNTSEVTGFNTDWVLGTDGFYYYTKVVNPAEAPKLFTKFTAPSHSNGTSHLDMHIIAQAIAAGTETSYSEAWSAVLPTNE